MRFRIGSVLVSLALALATVGIAMAQSEDDTPPIGDVAPPDSAVAAPPIQQPDIAPTLFLTLESPAEQDIEVPLDTAQFVIHGVTLPGAVVSIDGDLVDVDDQGSFGGAVTLDDGANEIDIVASDDQGTQIDSSLFITRGE